MVTLVCEAKQRTIGVVEEVVALDVVGIGG